MENDDIISKVAQEKFNIDAPLPYQRLVINSILCGCAYYGKELQNEEPKERITLLPTGAGKSLCFMLPYFLIEGITIVIFPLLSLISDQHRRCQKAGIESAILKGGMTKPEKEELFNKMINWERGILLTNMEILISEGMLPRFAPLNVVHLVFDEVHTLFEWGESFRPALQEGRKVIDGINPTIVSAFTATASLEGIEKIKKLIFADKNPTIINADPDRPNISYHILPTLSKTRTLTGLFSSAKEKKEGIDPRLPTLERPAILFFRNRRDTERTATILKKRLKGIPVYYYHAGLSKEEKEKIENSFFKSDNGILCSTNAYGMGVDKPNIRTVIHIQFPPTLESYLQESGRGGRDRAPAQAWLMVRPSDLNKKGILPTLLKFATENTTCRRKVLMDAMGRRNTHCTGCDVCNQTIIDRIPNEKEIFKILNYLLNYNTNDTIKSYIQKSKKSYFSALTQLKSWSEKEIEELLDEYQIIKRNTERRIWKWGNLKWRGRRKIK